MLFPKMKKIKIKTTTIWVHKPTESLLLCLCAHSQPKAGDASWFPLLTAGFTSSWPMTVNMRDRPTGVHTAGRWQIALTVSTQIARPHTALSQTGSQKVLSLLQTCGAYQRLLSMVKRAGEVASCTWQGTGDSYRLRTRKPLAAEW